MNVPVPALRVAVLISGSGSNLKVLIDARSKLNIDIIRVISSRTDAGGLQHARDAGIEHLTIAHKDSAQQDRAVFDALEDDDPELVVLAGYMRILGEPCVSAFNGRMINLHPSLLPLYPGLDTYNRVIEAGDSHHGASIHFVTAELDAGPVISQVRIPVQQHSTASALAHTLAPREHSLVRATVELFARHRVELSSNGVLLDGEPGRVPLILGSDDQFEI